MNIEHRTLNIEGGLIQNLKCKIKKGKIVEGLKRKDRRFNREIRRPREWGGEEFNAKALGKARAFVEIL